MLQMVWQSLTHSLVAITFRLDGVLNRKSGTGNGFTPWINHIVKLCIIQSNFIPGTNGDITVSLWFFAPSITVS